MQKLTIAASFPTFQHKGLTFALPDGWKYVKITDSHVGAPIQPILVRYQVSSSGLFDPLGPIGSIGLLIPARPEHVGSHALLQHHH